MKFCVCHTNLYCKGWATTGPASEYPVVGYWAIMAHGGYYTSHPHNVCNRRARAPLPTTLGDRIVAVSQPLPTTSREESPAVSQLVGGLVRCSVLLSPSSLESERRAESERSRRGRTDSSEMTTDDETGITGGAAQASRGSFTDN